MDTRDKVGKSKELSPRREVVDTLLTQVAPTAEEEEAAWKMEEDPSGRGGGGGGR